MKVLICKDHLSATERVAGLIADHLRKRPGAVLGLATGGTMLPLYRRLIASH